MLITAVVLGLLIGLVIGGLGGGGGVLTVPALVYLLGQDAQAATTGSVLIVGVSAVVGALARYRGIDWRTGLTLGAVGIPSAYLGGWLNHRADQQLLLLVFAAVTLLAATAMLIKGHDEDARPIPRPTGSAGTATAVATRPGTTRLAAPGRLARIVGCGLAAGLLTGFLGVGGGFLVVPALVIALGLPMSLAIGTSLLVIVLNAGASVVARLGELTIDWAVVVPFTAAAVLGTLLGKRVTDRVSGTALTRAFAVLLGLVGLFVGVHSALAG